MQDYRDLVDAAKAQTGLEDFGDDSWREGFDLLVRSLREEARLNAFGTSALTARLTGHLVQRLQIEDWYRRHPEIEEVELGRALFGVSLPRTGSSALSFLFASDPRVRYLRQWESSRPCPPPSTVGGPDPRRESAASEADRQVAKRPHTPSGIDGAMECLDLLALDFKSQIFQAFGRIPTYAEWLIDADLESAYAYERRVLKLLQWGEAPRPWRLKSPMHLLFLPSLDRAFPDARFVMTHRDPAEVIPSVCAVYADVHANFTDEVDRYWIGQINVTSWTAGIERATAFRETSGDDRWFDIHFRDMIADPVGEVTKLYAWLGEPVSDEFARNMRAFWEDNSENRSWKAKPLPEDYGLDLAALSGMFADYRLRMGRWTGRLEERS